jgi:UDP-N-acetylglucosamine:LPS N-acetylglucosamine transferase
MRPDLLITDTVPTGSFDEFVPFPGIDAMKLCARKLFIYRPARLSATARDKFATILPKYDLILIPELHGAADVFLPESEETRAEWTGPIISCDRSEMLDRRTALASLGLEERGLHIYVSFGGGGHRDTEMRIAGICQVLANEPDLQLFMAVGPLYRGCRLKLPNVSWLDSMSLSSHLAIADIAISAAGYNTFNELMFAGVPTIFLPLEAAIDDQYKRARRAEDSGAGVVISHPSDPKLLRTLQLWRTKHERERVAAAARKLIAENGARSAAWRAMSLLQDIN